MSGGVLRWESPPTTRTIQAAAEAARWEPVAAELRDHPGDWAVIAEGDTQEFNRLIGYIRSGRGPFGAPGKFEAKQRTRAEKGARGGRVGWLYARYVGGEA